LELDSVLGASELVDLDEAEFFFQIRARVVIARDTRADGDSQVPLVVDDQVGVFKLSLVVSTDAEAAEGCWFGFGFSFFRRGLLQQRGSENREQER
jgi:hypothetical protein